MNRIATAPLFAPQVENKLSYIDFQEALVMLHATLEILTRASPSSIRPAG